MYLKQAKILTKLFREKNTINLHYIQKDKLKIYMSMDAVMGIIPKTKEFEQVIKAVFDTEEEKSVNQAIKTLQNIKDIKNPARGNLFSTQHFKVIAELLRLYDDNDAVYIEVREVLRIETKDFIILLAPRGDLDLKDINFAGWENE